MDGLYAYKLAITAIMRNEGCNLEEWLNYHILAGVQHFYLYDNESADNTKEILAPYIKAGWVSYQYFPDRPGENVQLAAYNQATVQHRYDCEYMAFIDLDEFILPLENTDIYSIIRKVTGSRPFAAALTVRWKIFGSSGLSKRPGSVLEAFLHRAEDGFECNRAIKSIVNPRGVLAFTNPHSAWYYTDLWAVNDSGKIVTEWFDKSASYAALQLNHYFVKSREDWQLKLSRGRTDLPRDGRPPRSEAEFELHDRNEVYDDRILKYIEAMADREIKTGADPSERLGEFLEGGLTWYQQDSFPWPFEDFMAAGYLCLRNIAGDKDIEEYIDKLFCRYLEKLIQQEGLEKWMADYLISLFYELGDKKLLPKSSKLFRQYLEKQLAGGQLTEGMAGYFSKRLQAEIPDAYFLQ